MRRILWMLSLIAGLAACSSQKSNTQIVVVVWSDLKVPTEMDRIQIDFKDPNFSHSGSFPLNTGSDLPVVLSLRPPNNQSMSFTVTASGFLGNATTAVVSQKANLSFLAGDSRMLTLFLGRACPGGVCAELTVDPKTLPPYGPKTTLLFPDAGAGASLDGGGDSGAADGGGVDAMADGRETGDSAVDKAEDVPVSGPDGGGAGGGGGGGGGTSGSGGVGGTGGVGVGGSGGGGGGGVASGGATGATGGTTTPTGGTGATGGTTAASGGTTATAASLAASTLSLGFGPVVVGQSSSVTSFTITNNGQQQSGVLTVTSSNLAEFAVQTGASGDCVSGTTMLAGNASCTVRTIFTPSTAGARSGMFTFSATPGGNGSVSVSGAGITPGSLTASASVVPFGNVPLGSSSSVGSFTITNTGQQASSVLAVASSSALFAIQTGATGDCGSSLAGNASCTVRIVFTPTAVGGSSETITFSGTPGGSGSVSVTGNGVLPSCTLGISKLGSCKLGPQ